MNFDMETPGPRASNPRVSVPLSKAELSQGLGILLRVCQAERQRHPDIRKREQAALEKYRAWREERLKRQQELLRSENNAEVTEDVGSQTSMTSGGDNTERDSASSQTSQQSRASTTDGRKRRKITRMVREPESTPDPYQVLVDNLCDHIGIPQNRDFNTTLSLREKEEVGHRLKELLEVVSDGALISLLHATLNDANVMKLAELKGVLIPLYAEKLGLNDGRLFHLLSNEEQDSAGNKLRDLVGGVARDAIVPLMNATLSRDEVKKLCCLKGIQASDLETASSNNSENAEADTDDDENMALAIRDMQAQNIKGGGTNLETEQRNENHFSECNIPPTVSNHGAASNSNTKQGSNVEEQPTAGSSSQTEGDRARARVANSDPALKTDLMKLGMNLQKQIMDFICEKCD